MLEVVIFPKNDDFFTKNPLEVVRMTVYNDLLQVFKNVKKYGDSEELKNVIFLRNCITMPQIFNCVHPPTHIGKVRRD